MTTRAPVDLAALMKLIARLIGLNGVEAVGEGGMNGRGRDQSGGFKVEGWLKVYGFTARILSVKGRIAG
jgi:hypothetical protein